MPAVKSMLSIQINRNRSRVNEYKRKRITNNINIGVRKFK